MLISRVNVKKKEPVAISCSYVLNACLGRVLSNCLKHRRCLKANDCQSMLQFSRL